MPSFRRGVGCQISVSCRQIGTNCALFTVRACSDAVRISSFREQSAKYYLDLTII